jgi:large subunit ribosomal protein L3
VNHLLGYKKGMTQVFIDDAAVPVTIVHVPVNTVVAVRKEKKTDRKGIDIGIGEKKHPTKAEKGKYAKAKLVPQTIMTIWMENGEEESSLKVGDTIDASVCSEGDRALVTGTTKGKGFAGVIKRWGFHGGPRTHGQSDRMRAPGSIGAGTDPGRVFPGKKMPGKMGGKPHTLRNRKIVGVGDDYILVKGAIPGNAGGLVHISLDPRDEN